MDKELSPKSNKLTTLVTVHFPGYKKAKPEGGEHSEAPGRPLHLGVQ